MPHVAPSSGLRTWFHHNPDEFASFAKKYRAELKDCDALAELQALGSVTLITAAHDPAHSHVAVLASVLGGTLSAKPAKS